MYEVLTAIGLIVGIPASIVTIVDLFSKKRLWARFRDWLYRLTPYYRNDQLQKRLDAVEANQKQAVEYARLLKQLTESVEESAALRAQGLQMDVDGFRKELTQVDAVIKDLRDRMHDLHLSTDHPADLTTTQELQDQITDLQHRVADLIELVDRHFSGSSDHSPAAKRISAFAQAERVRKGWSDLPELPRIS